MVTSRNPHLDALIASTPGWKAEMVAQLRAAIHAADPEIVETWRWVSAKLPGRPPSSTTRSCATFASKDGVAP